MSCKHLYLYSPAGKQWSVASCSCKSTPYVPSMQELDSYCRTARYALCPFFLLSLAGVPQPLRPSVLAEAM
ncbi:hypothetical protein ACUUL3_03100 [Thiovibrio sp. JS02]